MPSTMVLVRLSAIALLYLSEVFLSNAFTIRCCITKNAYAIHGAERPHFWQRAARYGPPDDTTDNRTPSDTSSTPPSNLDSLILQKETAFRQLIDKVLTVKDPDHIPSLLAKNFELVLSLSTDSGAHIVDSILRETELSQGDKAANDASDAIDLILTFAEQFVDETLQIDNQNKRILGNIIMIVSDKDSTALAREQALDDFLDKEKGSFTAGFLRHLEGECNRIATAPKMTSESTRLLEILRMIQTRVLEEAGSTLGEAAQVLGLLIGYESSVERLAVLEAGLAVRGPTFARELLQMTEEALDGFSRVVGGADPELVESIRQIDKRLRSFLQSVE